MPRKIARDRRPIRFYKDLSYEKSDSVIKDINENINEYYNRFVKMYNAKKPPGKPDLPKKKYKPKEPYTRGRFTVTTSIQPITISDNTTRLSKKFKPKRSGHPKSINSTKKKDSFEFLILTYDCMCRENTSFWFLVALLRHMMAYRRVYMENIESVEFYTRNDHG